MAPLVEVTGLVQRYDGLPGTEVLRGVDLCVEAGESVLVTDRGTVVAEIRPPGKTTLPVESQEHPPGIAELIRQGRAVGGAPHDPNLYVRQKPLLPPGMALELLDAGRDDGADGRS